MRAPLRGLFELLLPAICAACAQAVEPGRSLCAPCDRALPRFRGEAPPLLPASVECVTATSYEGAVSDWMRRFKYPKRGFAGLDPAAQSVLRAWILEAAERTAGERPELVIPVALHARRLRARGFNPAALLAGALSRDMGLRHDPTVLIRIRDTPSQTGLDRRARRRNVEGAFRAREDLDGITRVWLVDDVVTTGSTAAAAAHALAERGVRSVTVVCAARTPLQTHEAEEPIL
ncbi:MAG: ComF family protein [Deltaproteobacteria bacterium]|nr:ComF family protein [Deltaproteobacteria bacterium]MBW2400268.1 ComF family protein [Deltaproteobacteria bacterium]MBW2666908.1 ComF family protein [Deltaproteobacteria bacterium]